MKKLTYFAIAYSLCVFETSSGAASTYDLATGKATVRFVTVGSPGGFKIHGTSNEKSGGVRGFFSRAKEGWRLESSFLLDQLDTGLALRTSHMKENYLETQKFPEAKLTIEHVPPGEKAPFSGQLLLHGQTRPVNGQIEVYEKENKIRINAEFSLRLEDFAIPTPHFAGVKVSPEIPITVEVNDALAR